MAEKILLRGVNTKYWRIHMPFVTVPGLQGKVYEPPKPDGCVNKHPCKDCFSCQNCNEDRCRICRNQRPRSRPDPCLKKISPLECDCRLT